MIIKDYVENEDGSCSFGFELAEDEAQVLIEFAIRTMIEKGLVNVGQEHLSYPDEGETIQ